jgi:hypothetical protein
MDIRNMAKQVLDVHRSSFDNGYEALVTIQDNAEKMVNAFLAQAVWVPEDGKMALNDWVKIYKKGREDLKHVIDDGYGKVEEYISSSLDINK